MFNLFQADIPIGNRLWFTVLAIVIAGSVAATPLADVNNNPVVFATNLLLLYGQATVVSALIVLILSTPLMIIEYEIKRRADASSPSFYVETEDYIPVWGRVANFLLVISYVLVVFWITNGNFSVRVGTLGLVLILLAEILTEWSDVFLVGYEYLELKRADEKINARVIRAERGRQFQVSDDWALVIAFLGDNGWEPLDLSRKFALFRRAYRKSLIPRRWIESMPVSLRRILGPKPLKKKAG